MDKFKTNWGYVFFSQLCHYHLYLTMFRLLQPGQNYLQHLIMDALFLRERLLMAGWSKLRHPSADMLWRGIEINSRESLALFKQDWTWWSVPFSKQFGAQSIAEFSDVTRLLGLQIEWRNNVFLTVRFKCVVLFSPIWSNCWRSYFTTVSFTVYAVCTNLS